MKNSGKRRKEFCLNLSTNDFLIGGVGGRVMLQNFSWLLVIIYVTIFKSAMKQRYSRSEN